jgi:hypothetical protein
VQGAFLQLPDCPWCALHEAGGDLVGLAVEEPQLHGGPLGGVEFG